MGLRQDIGAYSTLYASTAPELTGTCETHTHVGWRIMPQLPNTATRSRCTSDHGRSANLLAPTCSACTCVVAGKHYGYFGPQYATNRFQTGRRCPHEHPPLNMSLYCHNIAGDLD
jgi:hypothetical protein